MINSIIAGISIALNKEFGDSCKNYTEEVKQGLEEPCFFISCIHPTHRLLRGRRYLRENMFCIQYFPADEGRAKEECNAAADRMVSCLEWITVDGALVRGTGMSAEVEDGILNFFVNYDLLVCRAEDADPMEEISESVSAKG
ncbi:MAG: hypothetical protein K2N94_06965 [Lachnospiraceae bacterium]|nr:hypothetical protein [Lachnospiraceae bacterium]